MVFDIVVLGRFLLLALEWCMAGGVVLVLLLLLLRHHPQALPFLKKIGWILVAIGFILFVLTGFAGIPELFRLLSLFLVPFFGWILVQKRFPIPFLKNELNFFAFSTNAMDGVTSMVAFIFLHCFPKHEATGELLAISPPCFCSRESIRDDFGVVAG